MLWYAFALSTVGVLFHAAWAVFLCDLLKSVNKRIARFAFSVMLIGCSILALQSFVLLSPIVVLQAKSTVNTFTPGQMQEIAFICLRFNSYALYLFSVFFGVWLVSIAFLIFKSTFLPRVLAVLVAIAGGAWVIYLVPPVAIRVFPFIAAASAVGEVPLELWLIVMAVNEKKWYENNPNVP